MKKICLERDGRGPVEFEGELLARVSTATPNKDRWTELAIWAVDNSDYWWVVETVGMSRVNGETNRRDATPCMTPKEVHGVLSKRGEITAPGYKVFSEAAEEDEDLETYFVNYIRKVERL